MYTTESKNEHLEDKNGQSSIIPQVKMETVCNV